MSAEGAAIADLASGRVPVPIALMRLAATTADPEGVTRRLGEASAALTDVDRVGAGRLEHALAIWRANPDAAATVRAVLARAGSLPDGASDPIGAWARAFDDAVAQNPEAAVALYSLGSPDLLAVATAEIVERLAGWHLVGPGARVIEIGCGIGRFAIALAPTVADYIGLDVSPGMVAEARRRAASLPNVRIEVATGRDLAGHEDGGADLVLAVDVFPYLVSAGDDVVGGNVAEAARVLAPGGRLVVLNYSYRGDPKGDSRDFARHAERASLRVERSVAREFTLWDGLGFVAAKD